MLDEAALLLHQHTPGHHRLHQLGAPLPWVQDMLLDEVLQAEGLQDAAQLREVLHHARLVMTVMDHRQEGLYVVVC
jgi:hypothetical protein